MIPVQYGIGNIKQIGTSRFADRPPPTTGPSVATTRYAGHRTNRSMRRSPDERPSGGSYHPTVIDEVSTLILKESQ